MSEQNTNELSSDAKTFIKSFQVFEADFKNKNIFRDMTIPAEIYFFPVTINTYKLLYTWLTHNRNELFESLQLDYDSHLRDRHRSPDQLRLNPVGRQ